MLYRHESAPSKTRDPGATPKACARIPPRKSGSTKITDSSKPPGTFCIPQRKYNDVSTEVNWSILTPRPHQHASKVIQLGHKLIQTEISGFDAVASYLEDNNRENKSLSQHTIYLANKIIIISSHIPIKLNFNSDYFLKSSPIYPY